MDSNSSDSNSNSHSHVILFPFMSKGHTIPLLNLAHLLLHRFQNLSITIFTTKSNHPFISQYLNSHTDSISIIDLPFPQEIPGIPIGIENTENLPSNSLLPDFFMSTKSMQQDFERELQRLLPRIAFLISDHFLWWTSESASKFGVPRFSFSGMSNYTGAITGSVLKNRLLSGPELENELIMVSDFPWIKVTKND
uniref:UGT90A1 n=1 Tax=Gynostemma pentaphyllum TaxID=182084 RepID=A0A8F2F5F0_GYNPE|nr:UGT90A1 [Gynostemma pentaphyllum]